ncbi:MAG: DUF3108 domain-containing protein [Salinivirgaceae bacterium]
MKALFLVTGILFFTATISIAQCSVNNTVFNSGEEAYYQVYYHLGFIWLNAAGVSFKTEPLSYDGKKGFHFTSIGNTHPNYSWIYEVRDRFESKADSATLNPIWFSKNTSEGGIQAYNRYVFDQKYSKIYTQIKNGDEPMKADTLLMKGCVFDLLTAIYACRNLNFENKRINDTIPINLAIEDKIYPLHLRYLGKEEISTNDSKRYRCQKFSILLVEGTIFNGGEDMFVWVSDDKARVPIRIEAKILIGSIEANLDNHKGNKWPITAIVNQEQ